MLFLTLSQCISFKYLLQYSLLWPAVLLPFLLGEFCSGTLQKGLICCWTPPNLKYAQYHYEIVILGCWTPHSLKYSFFMV